MSRTGATPYASRRRRPRRDCAGSCPRRLLIVPLVEIAAIIAVGQVIGGWQTLLLLVLESLLGAWLVKREGSRTWPALQDGAAQRPDAEPRALRRGAGAHRRHPAAHPGFVTDVVGLLFILPLTRPITRIWLETVVARRLLGPMGEWPTSGPARRPGNRTRTGIRAVPARRRQRWRAGRHPG